MIHLIRLSSKNLSNFQSRYQDLSGLSIPPEFMSRQAVYGFFRGKEMIGGFILGRGQSLRTIEVFASPASMDQLYQFLEQQGRLLEICCFWIERAYRKNPWINAWCWFRMAIKVGLERSANSLVFGTNSIGLAKMYGYPVNSLLLHHDLIGGRDTFIFYAKRKHFLAGVLDIILAKPSGKRWGSGPPLIETFMINFFR